jgi:DNA-cytosine methyltransferase
MKIKTVISLFNGMSCGYMALNEAGIRFDKYYFSEVDKHAIKQSQDWFPDIIQIGDVIKWREWDINWEEVDLLMAGSPCQGFSFAGKRLAFDDPRSKLFFVFVEIWEHVKQKNPNAKYLLENVFMKKEHEMVISEILQIEPIKINSALLSAQNRKRNYWTNIYNRPVGLFGFYKCMIPKPQDKGILLKDILQPDEEVDEKYYLSDKMESWLNKHSEKHQEAGNGFKLNVEKERKATSLSISAVKQNLATNYVYVAMRGRNPDNPTSRKAGLPTKQMIEPRSDQKTNYITSVQKDNLVMIIPEATKKGYAEIKPGECFDTEHIKRKTRRGRKMIDKSNNLMAKKTDFHKLTDDYKIRRLTPTECSRLQTVDDKYQWTVSDTQAYKMLGNGWTVDVIAYILSFIKKIKRLNTFNQNYIEAPNFLQCLQSLDLNQ